MDVWKVVYTKPRCEKKAFDDLEALGLDVYCPLVETVKQWSDRKKKIKIPLFNSYVFVKTDDKNHDLVFNSHFIVRYLFWLGKPAIVRDIEIQAIKDFLSEIKTKDHHKLTFEHLQDVRINSGMFKNSVGKYLHTKGNKIVLQIESMGIVVKAEMHHSLIS